MKKEFREIEKLLLDKDRMKKDLRAMTMVSTTTMSR